MDKKEGFEDLLRSTIEPLGIALNEAQIYRLRDHYELLCRWNARINLTGLRVPRDIVTRHFGESLFLGQYLPKAGTVVDIGSGAGFPGVPIAVLRPGLKVTLVDSNSKKAAFLQESVRCQHGVRVRSVRFNEIGEQFDWAVWRGVALDDIEDDLEGCTGQMAAITSKRQGEEWARRGKVEWHDEHVMPWDSRRVVLIGKCPGSASVSRFT